MEISGWGRYPRADVRMHYPASNHSVIDLARHSEESLIARGLGRSYGDSALAPDVVSTEALDHLIAFDNDTGLLECAAGVSLGDILDLFVPRGWFLPVTPGTKFVTVGGAIASDVHGKNHHAEGSFADHIVSLQVATVSEGVVECSREHNRELFLATCGGMGLTGIILSAKFSLRSIQSAMIDEITLKAENLEQALQLFEEYQAATYSVAWIDCLSTGASLGRSLIMVGEHSDHGSLDTGSAGKLAVPVDMPGFLLNRFSIQAFNALYYNRVRQSRQERRVHYDPFFYPLDGIHQWNRLYGKDGFVQYQFVIPRAAGLEGMSTILRRIAESKRGSFLAVLKAMGKNNDNYLSFPMEGYTLALDFKMEAGILDLLDELDKLVLEYGGRIYLAKDARMSESFFKQSYPQWQQFVEVRSKYGADKVFNSLQSKRLGL